MSQDLGAKPFEAARGIPLRADAIDLDGTVSKVDFFADGKLIGTGIREGGKFRSSYPPDMGKYGFVWVNLQPGSYLITATATDDDGASSTSVPVRVTVKAP